MLKWTKAKLREERKPKWPTKLRNARIRIALARRTQTANIAAPHVRRWKTRRILIADAAIRPARDERTDLADVDKFGV
jgi:hypothetical protein